MQSNLQTWEDNHIAHGKRYASPICLQQWKILPMVWGKPQCCSCSLDILKKNMLIPLMFCCIANSSIIFLQNCSGAINGMQINAAVKGMSNMPYRGRKKKATQNVMCVVDMDLCFTYVYAGWEGSTHDSRIFSECINDLAVRFPAPADGIFL
jgi:hypothetical protein